VAELVSIVIPHYGDVRLTHACLESIARSTSEPHEVIVVDNGTLDHFPDGVQVVRNARNRGFAVACNQGAAVSRGALLLFLNNDTEPQPGWLRKMTAAMGNDQVGAVGSYLCTPDGAASFMPVLYVNQYGSLSTRGRSVDRPSGPVELLQGACLLIRRTAFEEIGGFDQRFWNGYEDIDLFLALRERGWLLWHERDAVVVHAWEPDRPERYRRASANARLLTRKWLGRAQIDERHPLVPAQSLLRHRVGQTVRGWLDGVQRRNRWSRGSRR
jgi:GT2 family glycosyltransferase